MYTEAQHVKSHCSNILVELGMCCSSPGSMDLASQTRQVCMTNVAKMLFFCHMRLCGHNAGVANVS